MFYFQTVEIVGCILLPCAIRV